MLEGYTHQATLIHLVPETAIAAIIAAIHLFLINKEGIEHGISKAPANGFVLRIFGYRAEQLYDLLQYICAAFVEQPSQTLTQN